MYEEAKQYFVEFYGLRNYWASQKRTQRHQAKEHALREFLLREADIVRLTRVHPRTISLTSFFTEFTLFPEMIPDRDPEFQKSFSKLKPSLIESFRNNERYGIEQGNQMNEHYLFRLSPALKEFFNQTGIIWDGLTRGHFYGFEDPMFYKQNQRIAHVISHEDMVYVNLYAQEYTELKGNGVNFDPSMEDIKQEWDEDKIERAREKEEARKHQ